MTLRNALGDWMDDNGWMPAADSRKFTGPNLNPDQGGELTIHETLVIINQLGWERKLERDAEPTSLTTIMRDALEGAGKAPAKDVHKLTRQVLDLWHVQRRTEKIAASSATIA